MDFCIDALTTNISTLEITGLYRRSFQIYAANIATIIQIALTIFIPFEIIFAFAIKCFPGFKEVWAIVWGEIWHRTDRSENIEYRKDFFYFLIMFYLAYLLFSFAASLIMKVVANERQASMEFSALIKAAGECSLRAFTAGCLMINASLLASFLLIGPGIFLTLSWLLTYPAIIIEGKGIYDGMARSWELASGYRWDLLKIICIFLVTYVLVCFFFNLLLLLASTPHILVVALVYSIPILALHPLVCILQAVVFFDLRARGRNEAETPLISSGEGERERLE